MWYQISSLSFLHSDVLTEIVFTTISFSLLTSNLKFDAQTDKVMDITTSHLVWNPVTEPGNIQSMKQRGLLKKIWGEMWRPTFTWYQFLDCFVFFQWGRGMKKCKWSLATLCVEYTSEANYFSMQSISICSVNMYIIVCSLMVTVNRGLSRECGDCL